MAYEIRVGEQDTDLPQLQYLWWSDAMFPNSLYNHIHPHTQPATRRQGAITAWGWRKFILSLNTNFKICIQHSPSFSPLSYSLLLGELKPQQKVKNLNRTA